MRVVLDTNVIVSAAITAHGTCARILDLLMDGMFRIGADDRILDEYDSVLHRPELGIVPEDASSLSDFLRGVTDLVSAIPLLVELSDPEDLPFLEVANPAEAMLVTGNRRHFPKQARGKVTVVSPAEFLELVRRSG